MPNNNDNYEYMKFLDLSGAQQIWNTAKQTFVQTVNGVGIDANGNCQVPGADALSIYPVGAIYLSVNNTSPASLFGGTWTQIKDVFLLGAGDTYSNGATGGAATHNHGLTSGYAKIIDANAAQSVALKGKATESWNSGTIINTTGYGNVATYSYGTELGGTTDSGDNMPPYLTVYIWKRTA